MIGIDKKFGIACTDPENLRLNTLIADVAIIDPSDTGYEKNAVVPDPTTLRHPTPAELEPFLADDQTPVEGTIEVIPASVEFYEYFEQAMARVSVAQTISQPGQLTTTHNTKNGDLRPGLHLDQKVSDAARCTALNLGPGGRFLLIGSLAAPTIAEFLGLEPGRLPTTLDVRRYAANPERYGGPALHCLFIPVRAGDGYCAPIKKEEHLVHDASTLGASDISTIRFVMDAPDVRGFLGNRF